jgi:hypothetical protein
MPVVKMSAEDVAEDIRSRLNGDSIAVVGGTTWEEEDHTEPLRKTDQRALESESVDIDDTFEAVYGVSGEELVDAVGDRNVYVTGGTIANPFARILGGAEPQRADEISLGELAGQRRFPFTFDAETVSSREFNQNEELQRRAEELREENDSYEHLSEFEQTLVAYATPAAEFRVNEELRPNYVVDRSYGEDGADVLNEFESIWVPQDGEMVELNDVQEEDYLSKRFTPVANGNDWQTDYSIFAVRDNPYGEGDVVAVQGAHGLGTESASDIITYPDSDIKDTEEVLRALGQFQDETGADEYQAVIQTYRDPNKAETRNNLVAVGEL